MSVGWPAALWQGARQTAKKEVKMIKGCIFDLDGTLLYTIDTIAYYVNKAFQKHNIRQLSVDEVKQFVGGGARVLIDKCMRCAGGYTTEEFFEAVYADYKSAYDTDTTYLTRAYSGIPTLIRALGERGVKLGILSNKPEGATVAVAKHFFGDAFDLVFGGLEGFPLKPDPTRLLSMIDELGLQRCEVAYIGDMETDIKTGKNADVGLVLAVGWGYQPKGELEALGADRVLENPLDILEVIS